MKGSNSESRKEQVKELSKQIQERVRRAIRAFTRKRVGSILSEFRGLRHIASVRQNNVRKRLTSMKNLNLLVV